MESEGGYLLPGWQAKELQWCWDHGVVKMEYDPITDEVKYFLADGTEIQREKEGRDGSQDIISLLWV